MLYLVRHGETSMNKRNLMCGRTDVELTENGKASAIVTGKRLKDICFSAAFCSPMKRAKNTLSLILSQNDRPLPDITEDPRIIERDFGYFEAQTNETHPEFQLRWRLDYDSGRVFMESIAHMKERIGSCRDSCRRDTHIPNAFRRRKKRGRFSILRHRQRRNTRLSALNRRSAGLTNPVYYNRIR